MPHEHETPEPGSHDTDSRITRFIRSLESGFFGFWVVQYRMSFLLVLMVIILGVGALFVIPKESNPEIDFGILQITTIYQGVGPEDIDDLITDKVEQEIKDLEGIKKITSTSRLGFSSTTIELENGVDVNDTIVDVNSALDKVSFPSDAEDPTVTEISSNSQVMFQALLYSEDTDIPQERIIDLARRMKDELEGKDGVTTIDVAGDAEFEYEIIVRHEQLESLGISIESIASTIRDYHQNRPIGNYRVENLSYDFRIEGEFSSIDELMDLTVVTRGDSNVKLRDIATTRRDYEDETVRRLGFGPLSEENGGQSETLRPQALLTFNKSKGTDIFSTADNAKENIKKLLETQEFSGTNIVYGLDLSEEIKRDYGDLSQSALQTFGLVFLVLLLFIGLKQAINTSIVLPLGFLVTFFVLDALGLTLNFLTNFSLVLTLGISIDTIIVIVEGASQKMRLGFTPKHAVLLAIRELKYPLISGAVTTLVVFVPMLTLPDILGKYLAFIPITVFSTLLAVLVLSLTLNSAIFYKLNRDSKKYTNTPDAERFLDADVKMLLAHDRENKTPEEERVSFSERLIGGLRGGYGFLLTRFIQTRFRRIILIFSPVVALVMTFMFLSPSIGFTLFPSGDNKQINITATAEKGTVTENLTPFLPQIHDVLAEIPEVEYFYISVLDNSIGMTVMLAEKDLRDER